MDNSVKPDAKYFIKVILIQITISVFAVTLMSLIDFLVNFFNGDPIAPLVIWLIGGILIILMWIISTPISYLWIKNLLYIVETDRVKIHKGILTKTEQNIPFRAITDFSLQRTIFDRFLGMGSINIQTAGQSANPTGYEGKFSGLVEYKLWHTLLKEKVKALHPQGQSLTTDEQISGADGKILMEILGELRAIRKSMDAK